MCGDLRANKEEGQRDPSRLERKAYKPQPGCERSGSQVRRLGRPSPKPRHCLHNRNKSRENGGTAVARSSNPGAWPLAPGQTAGKTVPQVQAVCALGFLLTWHYPGRLLNTLQAKCPKRAPPDFCVYYAFCLPDNPVVTSVLGRWEPTPPGQQGVRKDSVVGLCGEK